MKEEITKIFKDKELLELALTHKSWINEHKETRPSNERLEFLGDAVLEFVVSDELYKKLPEKEEGFMTALRANLVNTTNLARVAAKLKIGELLFLSKGEEETGGRKNTSLLANTMEAIIGALFIDGGIRKASEFIHKYILSDLEEKLKHPLKDPKSTLQELVQSKGYPAPKYEVITENGPDHDKTFKIQVLVNKKPVAEGEGKNKGDAAQNAASAALSTYL